MKDSIKKILRLPVKTPIEYWDKYWRYFTEKIGDKNNYEFSLDCPRFLIDNIISEIEYHDLKNKDNRELFRNQLNEWDKRDVVFNKLFHNKVALIQEKWDSSTSKYILSICKQINTKLNKGIYFDGLLEQLVSALIDAQTLGYDTKKEINKYTELIISEFIANGFVIEDIQSIDSIQDRILGIIRDESGAVLRAPSSCKGLNGNDFDTKESYYKAIEDYIGNRSAKEKISVLRDYYYTEPKDCFVLFRLTGIKGDIDCMIDDINIYAPHLKQYIAETPTSSKIEQTTSKRKYINAAIPVKHKLLNSSVAYASQKLDRILDLLSLTYNTSIPIKYDHKDSSIVENGTVITGFISIDDENKNFKQQEFITYMKSLDVSNDENGIAKIGERFTAINKNKTCDTLKLATAAHWYQKGMYAQNPEDKLLFHWIAIESLLKTDDATRCNITGHKDTYPLQVVQKVIVSILVKRFFHNYCFYTYININYQTQFYDNYLDVPDDIITKVSLNMKAGDKVYINKFLHHIKDLENSINDEILKTKLHELDLFYMNGDGIKKKEKEIYNDILLIYRLRNLIAHNAVYPRYLIDIYANKAQNISGSIIRYLIEKYRTSNRGLDEILIDVSSTYDEFILNIDNEILKLKNQM